MADIVVDTYKLNQYAQRISTVNGRITRLDRRLDNLYTRVGLLGLWNLMQADALTCYSWRLLRCQSYLQQTATDFESAERVITNQDAANFNPYSVSVWLDNMKTNKGYWDLDRLKNLKIIRRALFPGIIGFGIAESALSMLSGDGWNKFWNGNTIYDGKGSVWSKTSEDGKSFIDFVTGEYSVSTKPEYGKYKDKKILGDKDHLNVNIDQTKIKDESKQVNPDEKWYKEKATIFEEKAEAKVEGSVLSGEKSGSNDWAEGSVSGKLLTAEAHAEAAAGLYVYTKDKDGNTKKIFSPGVSAEVGASAAVVEVEAEGRIGLGEDKNMLGLYGDASAEALSAEAKAKVAVNRNEVYAGASAEANLAKVSAAGGVSVLGTDIGATGSLKVGVGAHAEIGYTDGKLKVDIGAAVGVGFDLGVEVDVSGTIDAVSDFASSAWDGVTDAWDATTDAISDAWDWLF